MVKLNIFYHHGNKILEYRPQKPKNLQKAYLVPRSDFVLVFRCALTKKMTLSGQVGFIKLNFDETTLFGMLALPSTIWFGLAIFIMCNAGALPPKSLHFDILADQIG